MTNEIFLLDDHRVMMMGLKQLVESKSKWKVTGTFETQAELFDTLVKINSENPEKLPEIIVFDIMIKDSQCFDLIQKITEDFPAIKSVVYSMYDSTGYVLMAKKCGAVAYLSKAENENLFLETLEKVHNGEEFFENTSPAKVYEIQEAVKLFTKTESMIFHYILIEKSNEEIANLLNIKLHSVENFVSTIYDKCGVKNRKELLKRYC